MIIGHWSLADKGCQGRATYTAHTLINGFVIIVIVVVVVVAVVVVVLLSLIFLV